MRTDYHSAHYPEQPATARHGYSSLRGIALVHDVIDGPLPTDYQRCDVFYTDPPWQSGYDEFAARAGTLVPPYAEFMRALVAAIPNGVPAVFVTGRHADRYFPNHYLRFPVRLNEHAAVAYAYGLDLTGCATAEDIGRKLAANYNRVGDPCCGYGNAARWFVQAGKRFVVSDINPRCIGYIAKHEAAWADARLWDIVPSLRQFGENDG